MDADKDFMSALIFGDAMPENLIKKNYNLATMAGYDFRENLNAKPKKNKNVRRGRRRK